jgi:hypothetical protein
LWSRPPALSEPPPEDAPSVLVAESSLLLTIVVVAMVVIIATAAFVAIGRIGGPTYQATIENLTPYGASQVFAEVRVTNLTRTPAIPTCEVDLSSSAAAFTGTGTFKLDRPVSGLSSVNYSILISLTTHGAAHVNINSSSVGCK